MNLDDFVSSKVFLIVAVCMMVGDIYWWSTGSITTKEFVMFFGLMVFVVFSNVVRTKMRAENQEEE
ncbi:MAG: hypothetical protein CXX81_07645 [Methanobacteriota archaeon]|nr:MAG: hypothetical protein CXX81_07645 [Euryarchaeota archaeon]HIA24619.1 hypothetical protein [Candidatus Poseidoniales archaeon]HIB41975.1 hypothetical protein [Candidatus Poseidoniales archaeon]